MNSNILHWSYRDFHELPIELIDQSDTLEEIYLKENFLAILPQWFFEFVHLKFIQLSGNLLQIIPDEISDLINLEHLDLSKNHLAYLPIRLAALNKLQYLNVSENEITTLPKEIGTMKSLLTLNASKNRLTEIPLELATSTTIMELLLNDNYLIEIPTKVMAMQSLKVFEAERCSLQYLPGMVGPSLTHMRVFNNTKLSHYPTVYEKFLRLHYDYWSENVVSADLLMIFLPDDIKRTVIPNQIERIRVVNNPNSLTEYCLRGLYHNQLFYNVICASLPADGLPKKMLKCVLSGPVTMCGNSECAKPLFTECHFSLMKKNQSPSHIIFSNMFCSKICLDKWHDDMKTKYHPIKWVECI